MPAASVKSSNPKVNSRTKSASYRLLLMMTFAMPSASAPSVPGRIGTHSSAFTPVRESRGCTETNLPRCWPAATHERQRSQVADDVPAGLQQVAAEGDRIVSVVQVVNGIAVDPLREEHRQPGGLLARGIERHRVRRAVGGHETVDQAAHRAARLAVQGGDRVREAGLAQPRQLLCHQRQRLVPRNLAPVAAPLSDRSGCAAAGCVPGCRGSPTTPGRADSTRPGSRGGAGCPQP